jgi:hypothetical protein
MTFVDHEALNNLMAHCGQPGVRAALVGYGEYAKHLINLIPEKIVAVYDPDPKLQGIHYHGIPVIGLNDTVECNLIAGCEYKLIYDFMRQVVQKYNWMNWYYPPRLHYIPTAEIKPFEQEALYKQIFRHADEAPISMMVVDKIKFLLEILQLGLSFPGNIVEMGSWQGGSTWFMAQVLSLLGESRKLYVMDLFELHASDPTATVCADEVRRRLGFYPNTVCIPGLIDDDACLAQIEPGPICFAHVDLGCIDKSLQFLWDRMPVGAPMLLDNYGHLAATWRFEDYFDRVGARIIRFPWSEQGLIIKR